MVRNPFNFWTALLVAVLICLIALASATIASAAPMPWKLFNEPAMLKANTFVTLTECPMKGEIFVATFRHTDGSEYGMWFEPNSARIIFSYRPGKDSKLPTEIAFGRVASDKHNDIPSLLWVLYNPDVHQNACDYLFNGGA